MALYSPRLCPATTAGVDDVEFLQGLEGCNLEGEDGKLGVDGLIERFPGAVQAEGEDVHVEDFPGPGKDVSEGFMALAEIPAHAHELGTLPRKDKTDSAHTKHLTALHHIRPRRLLQGRVSLGTQRRRLPRGEASRLQPLRPVLPPGATLFLLAVQPLIRIPLAPGLAGPELPSRHLRRGVHDARDVSFAGKDIPDGSMDLVADLEGALPGADVVDLRSRPHRAAA